MPVRQRLVGLVLGPLACVPAGAAHRDAVNSEKQWRPSRAPDPDLRQPRHLIADIDPLGSLPAADAAGARSRQRRPD